jgi:hypothetical protein
MVIFLILNGDTLVSMSREARSEGNDSGPIAVTVDIKSAYDSDDKEGDARR